MRHFDTCIGAAAREAHDLGMACDRFEAVVDLLIRTIQRRLWFDQPEPDDMSPAIDAEVVDLFQHAVAHWMDQGRASDATGRLARMLSVHRNQPIPAPHSEPPR
jgi:hypothetical protein